MSTTQPPTTWRRDGFVYLADGTRRWGRNGAAGVLFYADPPLAEGDGVGRRRFFLHLRAGSQLSGTWSTPGGAIHDDESVLDAALREFAEEIGPVPEHEVIARVAAPKLRGPLSPSATGVWIYTTILARTDTVFVHETNGETADGGWFTADEIPELPLHPGFAKAWPHLLELAR